MVRTLGGEWLTKPISHWCPVRLLKASGSATSLEEFDIDHRRRYDDAALDRFAGRAQDWVANGDDAYVFMINGAKVRAPAAAAALQQRVIV